MRKPQFITDFASKTELQSFPSRTIALSITNIFLMQAMMATFFGLLAAIRRSYVALKQGYTASKTSHAHKHHRADLSAFTMNSSLPFMAPLSRFMGSTPIKAAGAFKSDRLLAICFLPPHTSFKRALVTSLFPFET